MACLEGVSKVYRCGESQLEALSDINLRLAQREFVAVVGPSGSGKSTLLSILGCLTPPSSGRYTFMGHPVAALSDRELAAIRCRRVGFVFQAFYLLGELTALENVELPLVYRGTPATQRRRAAREALDRVKLAHRSQAKPRHLSGGEQQRVAIARAIVGGPDLILADEPTGNLDPVSAEEVMSALVDLWARGCTVVIVTHNESVWTRCQRVVRLRHGRIGEDRPSWGMRTTDAEGGE